ncbi:Cytochrome c oxidase subunit NDUFA4 [Halotydeus destructor]|nr:Cytochrome c oxidase subunit NDUFA4 [Halotydeus destructor]
MSRAGLKKNYAIVPLLITVGAGALWCGYYCWRLAVKSPEAMWNKRGNPEPWNDYQNKQYKFYSTVDFSKIEDKRPKF